MKTKIENKVASRSVYDMITDRITEQLAKGIVPWHQPHWKPSEEQMAVLEIACKYEGIFTQGQLSALLDLKEQLKKL